MNKISLIALAIAFVVAVPVFANTPAVRSTASTTLSVGPVSSRVICSLTGSFNLTIHVDSVSNLWSWKVNVAWDPAVLNLTRVPIEGSFMSSAGSTWFIVAPPRSNQIPEMSDSFLSTTGVNGSGDLAYLTFKAVNASNYNYASGGSQVSVTATVMLDPTYSNIAYATANCTVHVAGIGDLTGAGSFVPDGKCDIRDIATVAKGFGSIPGSPAWNANCDVNSDGKIDIKDIASVAKRFGTLYYP